MKNSLNVSLSPREVKNEIVKNISEVEELKNWVSYTQGYDIPMLEKFQEVYNKQMEKLTEIIIELESLLKDETLKELENIDSEYSGLK